MSKRNPTRAEARSELAQWLKGSKHEIADPLAAPTLEQQALKAASTINFVVELSEAFDERVAVEVRAEQRLRDMLDGKKPEQRDVRKLANSYKTELGECRRCNHALVGEIVEIVSGLTGARFYTHLDCIENGDELVENVPGAL